MRTFKQVAPHLWYRTCVLHHLWTWTWNFFRANCVKRKRESNSVCDEQSFGGRLLMHYSSYSHIPKWFRFFFLLTIDTNFFFLPFDIFKSIPAVIGLIRMLRQVRVNELVFKINYTYLHTMIHNNNNNKFNNLAFNVTIKRVALITLWIHRFTTHYSIYIKVKKKTHEKLKITNYYWFYYYYSIWHEYYRNINVF